MLRQQAYLKTECIFGINELKSKQYDTINMVVVAEV